MDQFWEDHHEIVDSQNSSELSQWPLMAGRGMRYGESVSYGVSEMAPD